MSIGRHGASYAMQHTSETAIESFHALVPRSPGSCDQTVSPLITVWQGRLPTALAKTPAIWKQLLRDTAHADWLLHVKFKISSYIPESVRRCMLCPWRQ